MNNAAMMFINYKTEYNFLAVFNQIIHNNTIGNARSNTYRIILDSYGLSGGVKNYPAHHLKT